MFGTHTHNQETRKAKFSTALSKWCYEKCWQLPSGYCTHHTDRPCLHDVCWDRVKMTHSNTTYTAVDDYDNSHAAFHKQLCGAALIIPDSVSDLLYSTLPIIPFLFLSNIPLCLPVFMFFLSFPVVANHTQEGCCCWILIFIYTASLWCPPSPPECSVSTSLSCVLPALPAQNISLSTLRFKCVYVCRY